jgi:diguanylate cyclase (GGDEF)-like protein
MERSSCFVLSLMHFLNNPVSLGASFWPASGFTIAALLLSPLRQWGWILLAVGIAEFGSNTYYQYPLAASLLWTAGNCVEPLVGALLVRYVGNNPNGTLNPSSRLLFFILAAGIIAPLIGGSIGAAGTIFVIGQPFDIVWPKYIVSDALGVLVIAPAILYWRRPCSRRHSSPEVLAYALILPLMSFVAFRNWGGLYDVIVPLLLLPLLLWAALRFGFKGTAIAVLFVASAANIATAFGYGPFDSIAADSDHGITILQILLAICAATALLVATLSRDLSMGKEAQSLLKAAASRDPLTGLYNRVGFQHKLQQLQQRRSTDGSSAAILVCDLDEFKAINDHHGHLAGDAVLKKVAQCLQQNLREHDSAARLGGDEFVVLLSDGAPQAVNSVVQRILDSMPTYLDYTGDTIRDDKSQSPPITISIGIAAVEPGSDPKNAFQAADKALYQAKHEGKARSIWAESASLEPASTAIST